MKSVSLRLVGVCVALAAFPRPPLEARQRAPAIESIQETELRADLAFLAGPGFRGRLVQTPDNRLAAEFIRSRFERLGLSPPAPEASYFQEYRTVSAALGEGNGLVVRGQRRQVGQGFYPQRFSATGRVRGDLVFAGFGLVIPRLGYDDYRGDAIRGRIVLVLEGEARRGGVRSEQAAAWRKALAAQERGAIGILFVAHPADGAAQPDFEAGWRSYWPTEPPRLERFAWGMLADWADRIRIPAAQISVALADSLLRPAGRTLAELARQAETTARGMVPLPIRGSEVELVTAVTRTLVAERNVVALLEGADPALRDEWLVLGAHYDHNGADGDVVFPGADDNASGVAGLLEIAEAYALAVRQGARPRRSVLFAAWNSEERGLLGSWAFTEQPLVPLDRVAGVLNLDMIGRDEEVPENGDPRFRGLPPQTAESNRRSVNLLGYTRVAAARELVERSRDRAAPDLEVRFRYDTSESNLLRRSDQWPFLHHGVPALFLHTGLHPDYHTPADRADRINYPKLTEVVRLAYQLSWDLANRDERLRVAP